MRSEELEVELGSRVRALRIAKRLTQTELAEKANVSLGAFKHLETGAGSTTSTMVKVLRALGEEKWISSLGPGPKPFNPLDILAARQEKSSKAQAGPRRVRHPKGARA